LEGGAPFIKRLPFNAILQQGLQSQSGKVNDDEHIAVLARVVIQMHLTMLQDLQTEITA
jgi:hypothetical protein